MPSRWFPLLFALAVALALPAVAVASDRVALVIGNSKYEGAPLRNPVNDARAMSRELRARGFTVIERLDAGKTAMERAIAEFGETLREGGTGIFYFAGHGMQVNGRNFLIPIDASITSEQRVRLETIDVDVVLDQMHAAKAKVNVVVLDACRNNPFERRFRSVGGGLAQINAPEGTLIAYATAPGKVAADGDGDNGLYTEELLSAMRRPGLKIEDVFKQVRIGVSRRSNGLQTPWEASSLVGDFYFTATPAAVAPLPAGPVAPAANPALELALWDAVKETRNPAELQAYLDRFPDGTFASLARTRMASLAAPPPAVPAPAPPAQERAAPAAAGPAGARPASAAPSPGTRQLASLGRTVFEARSIELRTRGGNTTTFLLQVDRGRITGWDQNGLCRFEGEVGPDGEAFAAEGSCPAMGSYVLVRGVLALDAGGAMTLRTSVDTGTRTGQSIVWQVKPAN